MINHKKETRSIKKVNTKVLMRQAILILPNQLFKDHPAITDKKTPIFLVEHTRYFTDFVFHKQKLILHRASMKAYHDYLQKNGYQVTYIEYHDAHSFFTLLSKKKINVLHIADTADHKTEEELKKLAQKNKIKLITHQTPLFLSSRDWLKKQLSHKKKYFMHSFYMAQRKELNLLMSNKKPIGGKWSYDTENRKSIPKSLQIPKLPKLKKSAYVNEAQNYVEKHFKHNPGESSTFIYPITFDQSNVWFDNFLKNRFAHFGDYQDAMDTSDHFLFHAVLTPSLNIGLITPAEIIENTINYAQKRKIPLNNLEGFIRQVIGWREFMFGVYVVAGKKQRESNFFKNRNKLPKGFYDGSTGVTPIDNVIKQINRYAYTHHIERLMVLGNYLLLRQTNPAEVYRWFMELFIDAYDWVMVPNVFGMSQYADGGLMTTKPYISSSHYILTMSNYSKGEWSKKWDQLFWTFIENHYAKLNKIPRMQFMIAAYKKRKK